MCSLISISFLSLYIIHYWMSCSGYLNQAGKYIEQEDYNKCFKVRLPCKYEGAVNYTKLWIV